MIDADVKEVLLSKADLVDGKLPIEQVPNDVTASIEAEAAAVLAAAESDATAKANASSAFSIQRGNHTGTQDADTITNGATNKVFTLTDQTKLAGIATGATANATNADLRDRTTHTGFQAQSTITNLTTDLALKADLVGGLVPSAQLPAFVDDVLEYANFAALPGTGVTEKIYVTLNDNKTFRWSGSAYVEISASLALGETSGSAYRGDRGKTAYDHSQITGNPHGTVPGDIVGFDVAALAAAPAEDATTLAAIIETSEEATLDNGTIFGWVDTTNHIIKWTTYANLRTAFLDYFQAKLVSGTNIKTINSSSILGSGDLVVTAGYSSNTISQNTTLPAGAYTYFSQYMEVADSFTFEIGSGAYIEIG